MKGRDVMATMKVKTNGGTLRIRSGPSTSFKPIGSLANGAQITTVESQNGWYKLSSGGWVSGQWVAAVSSTTPPPAKPPTSSSGGNKAPAKVTVDMQTQKLIERYSLKSALTSYAGVEPVKELKNIFNIPYQYLPTVDRRVPGSFYGRKFSENIIHDLPAVTIKAGLPVFLSNMTAEMKKSGLNAILRNRTSVLKALVAEGKIDQRYYSFKEDHTSYMQHVNSLCRQGASYMGLGKDYYLHNWDYEGRRNTTTNLLFGAKRNVTFYMDTSTSYDENASNSTGESMLAGSMGSATDLAREAEFLMGSALGANVDAASTDAYNETINKLTTSKIYKDPNSILARVGNFVNTLKMGGNLIFPDMWKESQYSKSYTIKIKLVAPYGTKECIFRDIMVPFYHLLALTLPRSLSPNGYISPFLVRAYAKGMFNCEMGIVDSISFTKGGDGDMWSYEGLPTQIDVTLNIRDLYPVMAMSSDMYMGAFTSNLPLMDFIATMSGVNLTEAPVEREIMSVVYRIMAEINDIPENIYLKLDDAIYNSVNKMRLLGSLTHSRY